MIDQADGALLPPVGPPVDGGIAALVLDGDALRQRGLTIRASVHKPRPKVRGSVWADAHWQLTREAGAVEAGQWVTARAPYLKEVLDTLTDPAVRRVVWMKGSQIGASEVGHIWMAYTANLSPAPFLMLYPTETALKNWSTLKLEPAIRANPALSSLIVNTGGRRDARNTMTRKAWPGGGLVALTAKSTAQMRSLTGYYGIAEEVDEYEENVRRQGDPLALFERALRNAMEAGGKLYIPSTPTLKDLSRIEFEFNGGDQRYYHVPCPHCNGVQRLWWKDPQGRYRIVCERDADDRFILESARFICEHCGVLIEEKHKHSMLLAGIEGVPGCGWVPSAPGRPYPSFQLGSQYSPFVSWATMMGKWEDVARKPTKRRTFVNLWVGEPYEEDLVRVAAGALEARAESYGDENVDVPDGVGVVVGGVDVQGDAIHLVTYGVGVAEEYWTIHWHVFEGDTGQGLVWSEFWQQLATPYRHRSGAEVWIAAVAIDAGYNTGRVTDVCETARSRGRIAIPVVGRPGRGKPLLQSPTEQKWKRTRRQARPVYTVHVDAGKDLFYARLRIEQPGPEYVHFPEGLDPVFYDQLTPEVLKLEYQAGQPYRKWVLPADRRNETQDCSIYAMAAFKHLGPKVRHELSARAKLLSEFKRAKVAVGTAAPAARGGLISEVKW